jgi:hypothetical protein
MSPSLRLNRRRISFDQPVGYPGAGQIPITRLLGPDRDPQEGGEQICRAARVHGRLPPGDAMPARGLDQMLPSRLKQDL